MSGVFWPEAVRTTRYSASQLEDYHRSPSMILLRATYKKPSNMYQIKESHKQISSSNDIESVYDGLIALDDIRLSKMVETDLISSNC
jgi:hypothetical protein